MVYKAFILNIHQLLPNHSTDNMNANDLETELKEIEIRRNFIREQIEGRKRAQSHRTCADKRIQQSPTRQKAGPLNDQTCQRSPSFGDPPIREGGNVIHTASSLENVIPARKRRRKKRKRKFSSTDKNAFSYEQKKITVR